MEKAAIDEEQRIEETTTQKAEFDKAATQEVAATMEKEVQDRDLRRGYLLG